MRGPLLFQLLGLSAVLAAFSCATDLFRVDISGVLLAVKMRCAVMRCIIYLSRGLKATQCPRAVSKFKFKFKFEMLEHRPDVPARGGPCRHGRSFQPCTESLVCSHPPCIDPFPVPNHLLLRGYTHFLCNRMVRKTSSSQFRISIYYNL